MRRPAYVNNVILPEENARFDKERKVWIICRYSSRRINGKVVRKIIDIAEVTPLDGRKELSGESPKISFIDCIACDYGRSRVLRAKLPHDWQRICGEHCEAIFLDTIREYDPSSYLLVGRTYTVPTRGDGVNVNQKKKYFWEAFEKIGITKEKLDKLSSIKMLRFPNGEAQIISPTAEQAALLEEWGVSLV